MGDIRQPNPVQLFCGVIFSQNIDLKTVRVELEEAFGPIDFESEIIPFDFTDYYQAEMGAGLNRVFYAFEKLVTPDKIVDAKLLTNDIELKITDELHGAGVSSDGTGRMVNLDPGYVDTPKMVLASTKDFFHRIYLQKGIYAEITLYFKKPSYEPFPWTYPDYRTEKYIAFFNELRTRFRKKLEAVKSR